MTDVSENMGPDIGPDSCAASWTGVQQRKLSPLAREMAVLILRLLDCEPCGLNRLTRLTGASGDRVKIAAMTSALTSLKEAGRIGLVDGVYEIRRVV